MNVPELAFYASAGPLTALPADVGDVPTDPDGVRSSCRRSSCTRHGCALRPRMNRPSMRARPERAIETIAEIRAPRFPTARRSTPTDASRRCRVPSLLDARGRAAAQRRHSGARPVRVRDVLRAGQVHRPLDRRVPRRRALGAQRLRNSTRRNADASASPSMRRSPDGAFLDAGEAWQHVRAGAADPEHVRHLRLLGCLVRAQATSGATLPRSTTSR